jgi:hypothetical protein
MTTTKRKVEVFTVGCPVCENAVKLVEELACKDCEVIVYNLNEPCESSECLEKIKTYKISRVPAVVVDGSLPECCNIGPVTSEGLIKAGVGSSL